MRCRSKLLFVLVILNVVLLTGCSEKADEQQTDDPGIFFRYSGALNRSFNDNNVFFCGAGYTQESPDRKVLFIRLQVRTENDSEDQLSFLQFQIPYEDEQNILTTGIYQFDGTIPGANGRIFYQTESSSESYARFMFEGDEIALSNITYPDNNHLAGRFSMKCHQVNGLRMLNGQLEDVTLGNDGIMYAQGEFFVELITYE